MAEKNNEGRFALFINDKGGNDSRPDRTGTCTLNGVEYKLSGWLKTSAAGAQYLSGVIEPKQKPADKPATPAAAPDDAQF